MIFFFTSKPNKAQNYRSREKRLGFLRLGPNGGRRAVAGDGAGTGAGTRVVRLGDFDDDATSRRRPAAGLPVEPSRVARGPYVRARSPAAGARAQQWRDTSARLAGPAPWPRNRRPRARPTRCGGGGTSSRAEKGGIYHATHASKSEDTA